MSDLHLGRKLCEFTLTQEHEFMLKEIISIIDNEQPDCIIIAGDVYNKSIPSVEAVQLFDDFLYSLSKRKIPTFIISGNHDSPERIAFGGRIMSGEGIYISPVYDGKTRVVTLHDEYGDVNFYMLPFVKPVHVRRFFPEANIESYNDAVKTAISEMAVDKSRRNVIVTHQYITGASLSESEEIYVGGTENVDADIFNGFDYVALGHIHRPQTIAKKIRYCGSPIINSLNEVGQEKSLTVAELGEKGELSIRAVPIKPLRAVREYKGTFEKLSDKKFYSGINTEEFVYITLTDEEDIPGAVHKLCKIYPYLLKLRYDNNRTRNASVVTPENNTDEETPTELFVRFYEQQNNHSMSAEQLEYLEKLINETMEEEIL